MVSEAIDKEARSDETEVTEAASRKSRRRAKRGASGRLLDLQAAEVYSGISAWTLRDLIASGDLPAVRPPRLRRVWIDKADLDRAIAEWKEQGG
jgi:excisionase family DNA binding protein